MSLLFFVSVTHNTFQLFTVSGVTPTAGYLTQGPSKTVEVLTSPPPMDKDDPLARTTDEN